MHAVPVVLGCPVTLGPLPRFHGFHRGWDGLVHIVLALRGQSMKDEPFIDYQSPCFFNFDNDVSFRVAILGCRESPPLDEGPATCLACIARQGAYHLQRNP